MPFLKGKAALVRSAEWLQKSQIILRDNINIVTFGYCSGDKYKHHYGLERFVYWHLPQLKFKNPEVQFVTFNNLTPTPWIQVYTEDDRKILVDCDSRERQEIHDHIKQIFGKPEEVLEAEKKASESVLANSANFGANFDRECICVVPGHTPCPSYRELPKSMQGKWTYKLKVEEITAEELEEKDREVHEKVKNR